MDGLRVCKKRACVLHACRAGPQDEERFRWARWAKPSLLELCHGENFRASESRRQACLDYAERSRKSQRKTHFLKNLYICANKVAVRRGISAWLRQRPKTAISSERGDCIHSASICISISLPIIVPIYHSIFRQTYKINRDFAVCRILFSAKSHFVDHFWRFVAKNKGYIQLIAQNRGICHSTLLLSPSCVSHLRCFCMNLTIYKDLDTQMNKRFMAVR